MDSGTIKVFISSTFRDLDEERNYLVRKVFPEINAELDGIQVNEVDLRWGITDEQNREKRVVDLCLKYLYESRPFFVGIIGDRYGSIISPDNIELSSLVENVYPQIRDDINKGLSVTEIEILNGTLRAPEDNRPHAIFFVKHTEQPSSDENEESFRKLQNLKHRILNQNIYPVYEYKKLNDLDEVKDFILKKLGNPHEQGNKQDNNNQAILTQCIKLRNDYLKNTPHDFTILDQLMPFIERAQPIAVLEGQEGAGKSTLVAQLGINYSDTDRLFLHLYGNVVDIPATDFMFVDFFLCAAKLLLQQKYDVSSSQKNIKGWIARYFKKVNLDDVTELVWLIGRRKWCVVLDNTEALGLSNISPMLYIIPAIVDGFSIIEHRYNVKIDYRILVIQNQYSPYNLNNGDYEKYVMPLGTSINVKKYLGDYLASYCKALNSEQLQLLLNSPIGIHPRSLFLTCEFMREWCDYEHLSQFIQQISAYNCRAEVCLLFINKLRGIIDGDRLRKLVALISLFSYGLNKTSLEQLSGMCNLDFYTAWSCLSKLAIEEPTGAIHWANDSIAVFINDIFDLNDNAYRSALASECSQFISKRIKDLYTPEKFFEFVKEFPNMFLSCFILSFPPSLRSEYYQKFYPMRIRALESSNTWVLTQLYEESLIAYLRDKGCFHIDYIKEFVYPNIKRMMLSRTTQEAFAELRTKREREGGFDGIKMFIHQYIDSKKQKIDELFDKTNGKWRSPTQWEALCYLESLIICRDWKQLETELINPEIINYVWQTSVYLNCWIIAIQEGGVSIIQPSMRGNEKMLYVSCALRNAEGIKYYSENIE